VAKPILKRTALWGMRTYFQGFPPLAIVYSEAIRVSTEA
jgi:hypothetical protein